jgi:hypothetical protein
MLYKLFLSLRKKVRAGVKTWRQESVCSEVKSK